MTIREQGRGDACGARAVGIRPSRREGLKISVLAGPIFPSWAIGRPKGSDVNGLKQIILGEEIVLTTIPFFLATPPIPFSKMP